MASAQSHTDINTCIDSQIAPNTYTISKIYFSSHMWAVNGQSSQLKHAHVCTHPFFFLSLPAQLTHRHVFFPNVNVHTPYLVVQNQLCWKASQLCVGTAGWRAISHTLHFSLASHTYTTTSQMAHCALIMRLVYCCAA